MPKIAFINKMDRVGADFTGVLAQMHEKLGARPVPVTIPWGSEDNFQGVIDLINQQALIFSADDQGGTVTTAPVPEEMAEAAQQGLEDLLEAAAESDDALDGKISGRGAPSPPRRSRPPCAAPV